MQFLEIHYRGTGKETVNILIIVIKSCQFNYSWGMNALTFVRV